MVRWRCQGNYCENEGESVLKASKGKLLPSTTRGNSYVLEQRNPRGECVSGYISGAQTHAAFTSSLSSRCRRKKESISIKLSYCVASPAATNNCYQLARGTSHDAFTFYTHPNPSTFPHAFYTDSPILPSSLRCFSQCPRAAGSLH
jgi:hypothetical protein